MLYYLVFRYFGLIWYIFVFDIAGIKWIFDLKGIYIFFFLWIYIFSE